jgi:hypothetical protein
MCRQAALVTFAGALSTIAADAQQAPATFFGGGGMREQCGALRAWTEQMERANSRVSLMHVQIQNLPRSFELRPRGGPSVAALS